MNFSTPHGDKLQALIGNHKLPAGDRPRVHTAIERYEAWIEELRRIEGAGENLVEPMVEALNRYKLSIDLDLIFDSKNDFLYRQKRQLKLDNTVLEEFMPWLVRRVLAGRLAERELTIGPANAFAQLRFDSDLRSVTRGGEHGREVEGPRFRSGSSVVSQGVTSTGLRGISRGENPSRIRRR